MSQAADAVRIMYRRHHPVWSYPQWDCACGLSLSSNSRLQEHVIGMLVMAVDTLKPTGAPQVVETKPYVRDGYAGLEPGHCGNFGPHHRHDYTYDDVHYVCEGQ